MVKYFILCFYIQLFSVRANVPLKPTPLKEDHLKYKISEIQEKIQSPEFIENEKFSKNLLMFRKSAVTYLNEFEIFCRRGIRKKEGRVKMKKDERKNCFQKLKSSYSELIEKVYLAQKKNLENNHKKEFQNLEELHQTSLENLEQAYKRYLK